MERPAPWAHGTPTLASPGWARWWGQLRGGLLAPSPPRGSEGAWISFHTQDMWEKMYPQANSGKHFNLVESQLQHYGTLMCCRLLESQRHSCLAFEESESWMFGF